MAKVRVRYKGISDVREFTRKQLREHGVEVPQDLVFHRGNAWALNIDVNEALEAIFRNDGAFTVSEITDDNQIGEEIITASVVDDTITAGSTADGDTGQVETNKYAEMTVDELKGELSERGLIVSGNKADLVARLVNDDG